LLAEFVFLRRRLPTARLVFHALAPSVPARHRADGTA
jgi:hypothetical protein